MSIVSTVPVCQHVTYEWVMSVIPHVHVSCHTRDTSHELFTLVTNYVRQPRTMYIVSTMTEYHLSTCNVRMSNVFQSDRMCMCHVTHETLVTNYIHQPRTMYIVSTLPVDHLSICHARMSNVCQRYHVCTCHVTHETSVLLCVIESRTMYVSYELCTSATNFVHCEHHASRSPVNMQCTNES